MRGFAAQLRPVEKARPQAQEKRTMKRNPTKLALLIAMTLLVCALLGVYAQPTTAAASLRPGSKGDQVKTLQTKLSRWGYYSGSIDGRFGAQTQAAVQAFQRKNGLTPDGVVGAATARALGMSLSGSSGSSSGGGSSGGGNGKGDQYLLARLIYGEARGESYKGKVAVGAVVLNRVNSASFPNSVSGVIYQSGAFSVVADGQINMAPDESAIKAARDAMNGWDPTNGCLYYFNPNKTSNRWMHSQKIVVRIGSHAFF